jgi:hypothetical protein
MPNTRDAVPPSHTPIARLLPDSTAGAAETIGLLAARLLLLLLLLLLLGLLAAAPPPPLLLLLLAQNRRATSW